MKRKLLLVGLIFSWVLFTGIIKASAMSEQELRIRALEEKIEALQPKSANGDPYNAHGVKKQGTKKIYFGNIGFHIESNDVCFLPTCNLEPR